MLTSSTVNMFIMTLTLIFIVISTEFYPLHTYVQRVWISPPHKGKKEEEKISAPG